MKIYILIEDSQSITMNIVAFFSKEKAEQRAQEIQDTISCIDQNTVILVEELEIQDELPEQGMFE